MDYDSPCIVLQTDSYNQFVCYSHEKKVKEAQKKLSEAEKSGADLSDLKTALQELEAESSKIKLKEDEIQKKDKVNFTINNRKRKRKLLPINEEISVRKVHKHTEA